jgi:hypothetical protein
MDDVLPGVIIDGVLGVDLKDIPGFKSQLDFMIRANSQDMKRQAQVKILYHSVPGKRPLPAG